MSRVSYDAELPPPSYAHARSSSTREETIPWREGSLATRRVPPDLARVEAVVGPKFRHPSPDGPLLTELVAGYERITGVKVVRLKKRNYLAACYRVHGPDTLPLVQEIFAERGTDTNLLRDLRRREPAVLDVPEPAPIIGGEQLPGLTYRADNRPQFDPASARRYDRHPSNPDAIGFFSDEELRRLGDRPAVGAITR
jgi:hypothetical protein